MPKNKKLYRTKTMYLVVWTGLLSILGLNLFAWHLEKRNMFIKAAKAEDPPVPQNGVDVNFYLQDGWVATEEGGSFPYQSGPTFFTAYDGIDVLPDGWTGMHGSCQWIYHSANSYPTVFTAHVDNPILPDGHQLFFDFVVAHPFLQIDDEEFVLGHMVDGNFVEGYTCLPATGFCDDFLDDPNSKTATIMKYTMEISGDVQGAMQDLEGGVPPAIIALKIYFLPQ